MEQEGLIRLLNSEGEDFPVTSSQVEPLVEGTYPVSVRGLKDLLRQVQATGPACLIQNYGEVLNVQRDFRRKVTDKNFKNEAFITALDIIQEGMSRMENQFDKDDPEQVRLSEEKKRELRKSVMVLVFLLHKFVVEIQSHTAALRERESITHGTPKRGSKHHVKEGNSQFSFWPDKRAKLLSTLRAFLLYPLIPLWDAHHEDVIQVFRCITVSICWVIKNSLWELCNLKNLLRDVLNIFGILCDRYNQGDSLVMRLVPMLKMGEDFGKILSLCLCKVEDERISKHMIVNAINQAADVYECQIKILSSKEQGFASFFMLIGKSKPNICLETIPAIKYLLSIRSTSTLRNAVLTMAAELLSVEPNEVPADEIEDSEIEDQEKIDDHKITSKRNDLLRNTLIEHLADINANVRSKALKLIKGLIGTSSTNNKLSIIEVTACLPKVVCRLQDSMSSVRKSAMSLLGEVCRAYPLSVKLDSGHYQTKIAERLDKLMQLYSEVISERSLLLNVIVHRFHRLLKYGYAEVCLEDCKEMLTGQLKNLNQKIKEKLMAGLYWEACEIRYTSLMIQREISNHIAVEEMPSETVRFFFKLIDMEVEEGEMDLSVLNESVESKEINKSWEAVEYYSGWNRIGTILRNSMRVLIKRLELGANDEVIEAIRLFDSLCEAGYSLSSEVRQNIICAMGKVLKQEGRVISELMAMFKRMYFPPEIRKNELRVVERLLQLVEMTPADLKDAMAVIIERLCKAGFIHPGAVEKLWDAFALKVPMWTNKDSIHAAFLLGVISRQNKTNLLLNVSNLANIGLGKRALLDCALAESVLESILLACARGKKSGNAEPEQSGRFPSSHNVFGSIVNFLDEALRTVGDETKKLRFPRVIGHCIKIIYKLSFKPEDSIEKILGLTSGIWHQYNNNQQNISSSSVNFQGWHLIWYLSLMTHILGSHVQYYEKTVIPELRRRKNFSREKSRRQSGNGVSLLPYINESSNCSSITLNINAAPCSSRSSVRSNSTTSSVMSKEMQTMLGNLGHDAEEELVKTYLENMMEAQGSFRIFRDITVDVCKGFKTHKSLALVISGVEALLKIMSTSSNYVKRNIKLLNRIWDETDDNLRSVKIAITKSCVPVIVRYPNEMEDVSGRFVQGLQDPDNKVRLACLDILVYLGLGDLLRTHNVLSACAVCLCDESSDIRDGAKEFFNQIAKEKGNALTNAVPEMISDLISNNDLQNDQSEEILRFILKKVEKKQAHALTERIINKFKTTDLGRKCAVLAFSLTSLCHNEKTIDVMIDNITCFSDKLDATVFSHFMTVVEIIKKTASGIVFTKVEAFHKLIEEHRAKWLQFHKIESDKRKENRGEFSSGSQNESESQSESENDSNSSSSSSDDGKTNKGRSAGWKSSLDIQSESEEESGSSDDVESPQSVNGVKDTGHGHLGVLHKRRRIESDSEDSSS